MDAALNVGEETDNPVEVNAAAMVDICLCLTTFFMCSYHFKELDGKVDAWLPKESHAYHGGCGYVIDEVRVFMKWDAELKTTLRKIGNRGVVASDAELLNIIRQMQTDFKKAGRLRVPILIDATEAVPWQDVVHVVNLCKLEGLAIEFAAPIHR